MEFYSILASCFQYNIFVRLLNTAKLWNSQNDHFEMIELWLVPYCCSSDRNCVSNMRARKIKRRKQDQRKATERFRTFTESMHSAVRSSAIGQRQRCGSRVFFEIRLVCVTGCEQRAEGFVDCVRVSGIREEETEGGDGEGKGEGEGEGSMAELRICFSVVLFRYTERQTQRLSTKSMYMYLFGFVYVCILMYHT